MEYQKQLYRWLELAGEDPELIAELNEVKDEPAAVSDRFYRDLAFGTGGLRGVIGAGTNRMNIYTVRRATQGLADYLNASGLPNAVAIAHDSRIKGELFARETARVLAANGITAYLYPRLEPTPALSWAVRYPNQDPAGADRPGGALPWRLRSIWVSACQERQGREEEP